jgi:hypothetical protein
MYMVKSVRATDRVTIVNPSFISISTDDKTSLEDLKKIISKFVDKISR